jgi:hypothetical protein
MMLLKKVVKGAGCHFREGGSCQALRENKFFQTVKREVSPLRGSGLLRRRLRQMNFIFPCEWSVVLFFSDLCIKYTSGNIL